MSLVMTVAPLYPNAPDLDASDYVAIGLATCFLKEEGEIYTINIAEPVPSAALEAVLKAIPTSYQTICGTTLGTVLDAASVQLPDGFPADVQICDDFAERAIAAARTYKRKPEASEHIPAGTTRTDFNYSLERKRVLNSERLVRPEDNVKQHQYTHQVL